ncbi:unnamed protein product [Allacma fusca]|uniref:Uncharacterized protein n=1 Tax=Allacma fusca TaxID=39272 RepID=A0A8J2NX51_9HEXA|nr:unnamed protein product [Allacma fusca]
MDMIETGAFEEGSCGSVNVGDDMGQKEYPFVTSPKALAIMRKLHEIQRRQLYLDITNSVQDYEHCPKGSHMPKECKPSIPGPFYSCPILHESGDDFCNLPHLSGRSSAKSCPSNSRRVKKRQNCRKCSATPFNLYDASIYHENYLKQVTYAKLKPGKSILRCYTSPRDSRPEIKLTQTDKEFLHSDDELPLEVQSQSALADLRDLIDPRKLTAVAEEKKSKKKRNKIVPKPVVLSRYRDSTGRRGRGLSSRSNNPSSIQNTSDAKQAETYKNPFPMPDVFEGIYFGNMPESFNTLPVSLQNFKRSQMKMAEEAPRIVGLQQNETGLGTGSTASLRAIGSMQSGLKVSEHSATLLSDAFSTAERMGQPIPSPGKTRGRNVSSQSSRNVSSRGKTSRKLIPKEGYHAENNLPGRKNKSAVVMCHHNRLLTPTTVKGKGGRKKLKHAKLKHSTDLLTFKENSRNHQETENNFRGKDGKFSTEKFRESLISFIENFQNVKNSAEADDAVGPIGDGNQASESTSTRRKVRKIRGTPKRTTSSYPQGPVTITIYKSKTNNPIESVHDFNTPDDFPRTDEVLGQSKYRIEDTADSSSQIKKRKPKAISLNRNVIKKRQK